MIKIKIKQEDVERASIVTVGDGQGDGKQLIQVSRDDGNFTSKYYIGGVDYNTLLSFVRAYGYTWAFLDTTTNRCSVDDELFNEWLRFNKAILDSNISDTVPKQQNRETDLLDQIASLESQVESLENRAEKAEQLLQMYKNDNKEISCYHELDVFPPYPIG